MEILFMGTGAADWDIKKRADGEFFRRCTSVMINDDLLIDFNDDTLDYIERHGADMKNIKNVLITHTHEDHYSRGAINRFFEKNTTVWFDKGAEARIGDIKAEKKIMPLYKEVKIGNHTVIAVGANHLVSDSAEQPLHYIISDGEKCIFWGCDGAWIICRSWHEIRKYKYDLVVFDRTLSDKKGDYRIFEHNNLNMIAEMNETFRSLELMKPNSKTMISHMSKYSQYSHEDLEKILKNHGIVPAYDGMKVCL